eukprot:TRINITY_DN4702_c0_g1_i1.p1 TRINITY_DN4702_c0_g1~~TRINITY_DN4702_c0_g1_i1.p1  ORF type:complete len:174 (-),score=36.67 TRINITY_DN4702_c0_g1_i1:117-596(-)
MATSSSSSTTITTTPITPSIPLLPTTGTFSIASLEKHCTKICSSNIISSIAILSTLAKNKNIVQIQKNMKVGSKESIEFMNKAANHTLHMNYVSLSGLKFVITNVNEKFYLGRSCLTSLKQGIIIWKFDRFLLVAIYSDPISPVEAVSFLDTYIAEHMS